MSQLQQFRSATDALFRALDSLKASQCDAERVAATERVRKAFDKLDKVPFSPRMTQEDLRRCNVAYDRAKAVLRPKKPARDAESVMSQRERAVRLVAAAQDNLRASQRGYAEPSQWHVEKLRKVCSDLAEAVTVMIDLVFDEKGKS